MSFAFSTMFPITNDNTEYELIESDYVSFKAFQNKNISYSLESHLKASKYVSDSHCIF